MGQDASENGNRWQLGEQKVEKGVRMEDGDANTCGIVFPVLAQLMTHQPVPTNLALHYTVMENSLLAPAARLT